MCTFLRDLLCDRLETMYCVHDAQKNRPPPNCRSPESLGANVTDETRMKLNERARLNVMLQRILDFLIT